MTVLFTTATSDGTSHRHPAPSTWCLACMPEAMARPSDGRRLAPAAHRLAKRSQDPQRSGDGKTSRP